MGTRGAFGFFINGEEKVTYNHCDSYPDGLGHDIIRAIKESSLEEIKQVAERIELINEDSIPTAEQIKDCEPFTDLNVSNQSVNDWYCLLRGAQGDLSAYTKQGLKYMSNGKNFLKDSLFCEWAYIINLDNNTFEFYKGFNRDVNGEGRYAHLKTRDTSEFCGVVLVKTAPLEEIFASSIENQYDVFKKPWNVEEDDEDD